MNKQRGNALAFVLLAVGIIILAWAMFERAVSEKKEHARLMQQCMDDGKPEYECHVLLKPDPVPTSTPIVIPVQVQ